MYFRYFILTCSVAGSKNKVITLTRISVWGLRSHKMNWEKIKKLSHFSCDSRFVAGLWELSGIMFAFLIPLNNRMGAIAGDNVIHVTGDRSISEGLVSTTDLKTAQMASPAGYRET